MNMQNRFGWNKKVENEHKGEMPNPFDSLSKEELIELYRGTNNND